MRKLYITEKLSVATALAGELGKAIKKEGYYELENGDFVAWLQGHIVKLFDPKDYAAKYEKWRLEDLPIVPKEWMTKLSDGKVYDRIFNAIDELLKSAEVVIHVGDPDREGQLIVDEVLEFLSNKLPVKRLFISAIDSTSIQRGLANLEDNSKFQNMYKAALARQRTDWLFGMNASRKYTLEAQKRGLGEVLRVGRVKTPVLGLVVRRNEEIENFKSVKHYGINAFFAEEKGIPFKSEWQIPETLLTDGKLLDVTKAREIEIKLKDKNGVVLSADSKIENKNAPLPFSLSKLQRAAGAAYGFTPIEVLELTQSLYEKKLVSYPRSSSEYIPESQYEDGYKIINNLRLAGNEDLSTWCKSVDMTIKSRAFNDKKVDAHHAIIPTTVSIDLAKLKDKEQKLYLLIAKQYIAQFYEPYSFNKTEIIIECENEKFKTTGNTIIKYGWKALIKEEKNEDDEKTLPALKSGQKLRLPVINITEKNTEPPAYFTQDTLIGAMEGIHRFVKNPSIKDILKETKGIGTEATRANIIKELLDSGLLEEKKDKKKAKLIASEAGNALIKALPEDITFPDSTGLMELELDLIAQGKKDLKDYMNEQENFIKELMDLEVKFNEIYDINFLCPACGNPLRKRKGTNGIFWGCSNYQNGCKATFQDSKDSPIVIICPSCKKGYLIKRKGKDDKHFWGCSRYQDGCKGLFADKKGKPEIKQAK